MIRSLIQTQRKKKAIFVALFLVSIFFSLGTIISKNNDGMFSFAHSAFAETEEECKARPGGMWVGNPAEGFHCEISEAVQRTNCLARPGGRWVEAVYGTPAHCEIDEDTQKKACTDKGDNWVAANGISSAHCETSEANKEKACVAKGGTYSSDRAAVGDGCVMPPKPLNQNGTNCGLDPLSPFSSALQCVFKMLLFAVLQFFGMLVAVATVLFAWVVDPANISGPTGILNRPSIVEIWTNVRDFLNMFFIMILLFSAFCTIFQVKKWNLKDMWLNIVINALLVNFSFTIARFIIDVSNVTMYYLLNNIFPTVSSASGGGSILANVSHNSGLETILTPPGDLLQLDWLYLLASIIFVFILAITFLCLAVMMLIRIIALAIIIMFAPVGFVGYIFPALHKFADSWWDGLFKYSFFGPLMVFMLAVSIRIMTSMGGSENMQSWITKASQQTTGSSEASWVANAAFFAIPIIILWIGMGAAQKLGGAGAATVFGAGAAVGAWAGKKFSGYNAAKKQWDGFSKQRKARQDEKDKNNLGSRLGKRTNEWQDSAIAAVTGPGGKAAKRLKKTQNSALDEDIKNSVDRYDTHTNAMLKGDLAAGSGLHARAMAGDRDAGVEYMAKYKQFMNDPVRKQQHEAEIRSAEQINARSSAAYMSATNDAEKQAAAEAHIQQKIADSYTAMNLESRNVKSKHYA